MVLAMMRRPRAQAGEGRGVDDPGGRTDRDHLRVIDPESGRDRVEVLYRRYRPVIYRRCLRFLRDPEESRDVTQDVFMKLMRELDRVGAGGLSIRWVHRVTTNHCLNTLREGRRNRHDPIEEYLETWATPPTVEPAEKQLARAVLARFDGVTQAVAVAVFVHGMEYDEVSELLGISRRTVCRKVDRFLLNARKYVARSFA
jgi:RNA polymerase sigma-70 factor (ECF subfamily)